VSYSPARLAALLGIVRPSLEKEFCHMRKRNSGLFLTLTVLIVFFTLGATGAWAADATAGKDVYSTKCKSCHGADGAGNPAIAKMLKVEFRHLGSPEVQKYKDDEIKKRINAGEGKMKPVTGISSAEVDNVVAFVRTLKK
jgi:mono/diheme cytochrome c family protein